MSKSNWPVDGEWEYFNVNETPEHRRKQRVRAPDKCTRKGKKNRTLVQEIREENTL